MTMAVGCIDIHNLEIKNKYDVTKAILIIFDDKNIADIDFICKLASKNKKNYEFKYRDIVQR